MTSGVYKRIKPVWNKGKKFSPLSAEHKAKQGEAIKKLWASGHFEHLRGKLKQGFMTGRKHTPETKEKMRLAKLGTHRIFTAEHKANLSKALKGKLYTTDHKLKKLARDLLNTAIKRGKVIKKSCEVCGNPKADGHHSDYTKPYLVNWLCKKHHKSLKHRGKKYAL